MDKSPWRLYFLPVLEYVINPAPGDDHISALCEIVAKRAATPVRGLRNRVIDVVFAVRTPPVGVISPENAVSRKNTVFDTADIARCGAPGCDAPAQGPAPMCLGHWFDVPAELREDFFAALDGLAARLGEAPDRGGLSGGARAGPDPSRRLEEARRAILTSLAGPTPGAAHTSAPTAK